MSGVLGGLAALTRPVHVFYLIAVGAWLLLKRQLRWAMLVAIGALIVDRAVDGSQLPRIRTPGADRLRGRHHVLDRQPSVVAGRRRHGGESSDQARQPAAASRASGADRRRARARSITARRIGRIASQPRWWLGLELRKLFYLIVPTGPSYTLHSARYLRGNAGFVRPAAAVRLRGPGDARPARPVAAIARLAAVVGDRRLPGLFSAGALPRSGHRSGADRRRRSSPGPSTAVRGESLGCPVRLELVEGRIRRSAPNGAFE